MARNKFSAGVVIVRESARAPSYLLLRVFGSWDFPKGGLEEGETPLEAAIREVLEETTLTGLDFRWGEAHIETVPYSSGKIARYYVAASLAGDVALPISPELGRPEHHEFRWMTAAEAKRLLPDRLQPVLEWAVGIVEGEKVERG